jgi:hypothetical protein
LLLNSSIDVLLITNVSYEPATDVSFVVLVVGYTLDVPGYIILTAPAPPVVPAPVAGFPL